VSDRIVLANMVFQGRHGVLAEERREAQPFEVDVELEIDLRPAGVTDDLARTVDYRTVFEVCRRIVEGPSHQLIEALAEAIAAELLASLAAPEVVVRVRPARLRRRRDQAPPLTARSGQLGLGLRRASCSGARLDPGSASRPDRWPRVDRQRDREG
jgi:dihydroneopterin aldolase